jgi:hypothetical protein
MPFAGNLFSIADPLRLRPNGAYIFLSMGVVPMPPRFVRLFASIHRQAIDSLLSMDAAFV